MGIYIVRLLRWRHRKGGVIHHMASTPSIVFGNLFSTSSKKLNEIQALFQQAEIESTLSEDVEVDLWKKFIFICIGGLMAITKTTCGELRAVPKTRKLMTSLLTEIFELSKKMGINTALDVVEKTVSFFDTLAHDATFSLTRDVWENKPSEIDYQNGTVVNLAERFGVSTSVIVLCMNVFCLVN